VTHPQIVIWNTIKTLNTYTVVNMELSFNGK